jgi:hypothetical protein
VRPSSSATNQLPIKNRRPGLHFLDQRLSQRPNPSRGCCFRDTKRHLPCSITARARKPSCLIWKIQSGSSNGVFRRRSGAGKGIFIEAIVAIQGKKKN